MARFQYNGDEERVFPTIAVTVKSGDQFDAPDDFVAEDVTPVASIKKVAQPDTPAPVTATTQTAGDK